MTVALPLLPMTWANASQLVVAMTPMVRNGGLPLRHILSFCANWRRRGISALFMNGHPQPLLDDLQRSGAAFRHWLATAPDTVQATGKATPWFDAVAAGDDEAARGIARAARANWNADVEYEDDFLYARWLMQRFATDAAPGAGDALLARWEAVLDGAVDPRLAICRALAAGDAEAFEAALAALLAAFGDAYAQAEEADRLTDDEAATERNFCVEGLALVRLAERVGITPAGNHPFVPSLARGRAARSFAPDSWAAPDRI